MQGSIGPNGTHGEPGQPGLNIINGTNLYYNIGNNTDLAFQDMSEALDNGDIAICGNYYVNGSTFPGSYLVTFDGMVGPDTYRTEIRGSSLGVLIEFQTRVLCFEYTSLR